jgi:hypothetical protein
MVLRNVLITALLLWLGSAGAARADDLWQSPDKLDVALLLTDELLILVDMKQTIGMCNDRFNVICESNPILGQHPTTERIVGWSVGAMLGTAALWYVLPDPWRKTFTITLGGGESLNVANNFRLGASVRF